MKRRRTLALAVAGGLLVSTMISGASAAADEALVAAAKKEGTVVWYTTLIVNQLVRPMISAFEEKYPGITVEHSRSAVRDIALKVINESRAGQVRADLFDGQPGIFSGLSTDYLQPEHLPNADDYPAEYRHPEGYWHALNRYFVTAVVNTNLVKEGDEPKTYQDLLDPKWRGKIAWKTDPTESGPPGFIGMVLKSMGQEKGMEYLRKLSQQELLNIPASARVVLNNVIAGEYPIALLVHINHIDISREQGAPVKPLKLEPLIATVNYTALLKDSPHPNAGKLFLEYMLSREGQKVFAEANYFPANPHVDAKNPALTPEGGEYDVVLNSAERTLAHLEEWTAIYHELFD